jgi:hypothetical protein
VIAGRTQAKRCDLYVIHKDAQLREREHDHCFRWSGRAIRSGLMMD